MLPDNGSTRDKWPDYISKLRLIYFNYSVHFCNHILEENLAKRKRLALLFVPSGLDGVVRLSFPFRCLFNDELFTWVAALHHLSQVAIEIPRTGVGRSLLSSFRNFPPDLGTSFPSKLWPTSSKSSSDLWVDLTLSSFILSNDIKEVCCDERLRSCYRSEI